MSSLFRWGMLAGRAPPASARQQAQAGSASTATVLVPKARLEEAHARHQLQLGALQAELESSNALVNSLRQQRDTWKGMSAGHKDMYERKLKEAQFGFESREESLRTLLEAEQAHGAVMRQRLKEAHQSLQELAGRLCDREALIEELRGRRNTEARMASDSAVQQLRAELAAVRGRAQAQGALLSALQQCGYHMSQCVNREQLEQHAAVLTQLLGQISSTLEGSGVQGVEGEGLSALAAEEQEEREERRREQGHKAGAAVPESVAAASKARQLADWDEEEENDVGLTFVCLAEAEEVVEENVHEQAEQVEQLSSFSSASSSTAPAPTSAPRPALVFERCAVRLSRGRSQLTAAVQLGSFPQYSEVMQQYQRRVAAHEEREAEAREVEQAAAAACVQAQAAASAAVAATTAAVGRRQAQAQQGGRAVAAQAKKVAGQGAAKQQGQQRQEVEQRKEREERHVKGGGMVAVQALGGDGLVVVQLIRREAAAATGVQGGNVQAKGMCKQGRGGNRGRRGAQRHVVQTSAAQ